MSGWVTLLPLVGAVVGGFVGAWAHNWYRNREAQKARDEERKGLLILLSVEVRTNNRVLERFLEQLVTQPDIDNRTKLAAGLHSAVWDESRARFAQLLPRTYVATVALYYMRIEAVRLGWTHPSEKLDERDTEYVRRIRQSGVSVIKDTQDYIGDPEFAAPLLDEHV